MQIRNNTHFVQINLSDLVETLGEDETKNILSSFACPINKDVEKFLRTKAIEFSKRGFSKTHLVFWTTDDGTEKELVGYYTIAPKTIKVHKSVLNAKERRKLNGQGDFNDKTGEYIISAPLIGQLGKNFCKGNETLISGSDLLQLAMDKVRDIQRKIGGRFVYLECEEKEKLINFYESNCFKQFGKRYLDRDETDLSGEYLIQFFAML